MKFLIFVLIGMCLITSCDNTKNVQGLKQQSIKDISTEPRVALLIDNATFFQSQKLKPPFDDALAIKKALEKLGFKIIYRTNANKAAMEKALREFRDHLQPGGVGLFYYSGLGANANGHNFLVPIGVDYSKEIDLQNITVDVGLVLEAMKQVDRLVKIVIVDALHSSPFKDFRSVSVGFTNMEVPEDSLIAYAASNIAYDVNFEGYSLFTTLLLDYLPKPGLTLEALFRQIQQMLSWQTGDKQIQMQVYSSFKTDFCFVGECDKEFESYHNRGFFFGRIMGLNIARIVSSTDMTKGIYSKKIMSTKPEIPTAIFSWPPPKASAKEAIPQELLTHGLSQPTLKDIDGEITKALRQIGHSEFSYFTIPSGYALVTRIEKIQKNGTPIMGLERWEAKLNFIDDGSSVKQYFRNLFTANKGYYRIIVFIVSSTEWGEGEDRVSEDEAIMWLRKGLDRLPNKLASTPFSPNFVCTALIYEFEQTSPKKDPHLLSPGKLAAHTHLEASGFYKAIGE
ncbi:MAG: caspase family protein [Myxococcaceae bacterium]